MTKGWKEVRNKSLRYMRKVAFLAEGTATAKSLRQEHVWCARRTDKKTVWLSGVSQKVSHRREDQKEKIEEEGEKKHQDYLGPC